MKRLTSICDLERQAPAPTLPTSQHVHFKQLALFNAPRRQIQRMVLLTLLSLTCIFSSTVMVFSTHGSDNSVLERIKAFVGFDSSAPMQEAWTWKSYDDTSRSSLERLQRARMHSEFALSFSHFAQQTSVPRGLVMPLFDDIAHLGLSAILELRALGVDLPIEIPHCGGFKIEFQAMIESRDPLVRVYDVCAQALAATNVFGTTNRLRLFCGSAQQCHKRFRGFYVKIIAVVFSQFQELMLVDADTMFFQNLMQLWSNTRYKQTGTLFFHDRIGSDTQFLAARVATTSSDQPVSHLHAYLSKFDVSPFRALTHIPRSRATVANVMPVTTLQFAPSSFLLSSHAWNLRAGHEMDSSLVLWSKSKQPHATAILTSFVALNGVPTPPSYGDKELFFLACELAETQYAFSDHGVGALGTDLRTPPTVDSDGETASDAVLCGGGLQYVPSSGSEVEPSDDPDLLYMNSDDILQLDVHHDKIYRTRARPATFYAGSFTARKLPQECPFDVRVQLLSANETAAIARRQQFHNTVQAWTS